MNFLIVVAHPDKNSFNHAIATKAQHTLEKKGVRVFFHDLYTEDFPSTLPKEEFARDAKLPAVISSHCEELKSADGIIIVHPNWWGQPPAILKGWIDRVIRPEVAYRFREGDSGEGIPEGLLKAKIAIVFNTSNTTLQREQDVFGDPLETIWRNCIFGLCGVNNFMRKMFGTVVTSAKEQRHAWLKEVETVVNKAVNIVADQKHTYHTDEHGFTEL